MKHILKAALLAGALGASSFLMAAPADARDRRSSSVSVYVDTGPVAVRARTSTSYDRDRRRYYRCRAYHHRCYRGDRGRHHGWRRGRHRDWRD